MCGIAGFIDFNFDSSNEILTSMTRTMNHRGPDGEGYFFDETYSYAIGMGHKRLSIIDLSSNGAQPMQYQDLVILLNGEIYNYRELRIELEEMGHHFKTSSDTEVVLHAYKQWSHKCLDKFIGMFAIVLYDKADQILFLARDRAGTKPFFYYLSDSVFMFASELKAFHKHPAFKKKINTAALASYMQFGYVKCPMSIFENTWKLPQGTYAYFNTKTRQLKNNIYWEVDDHYNKEKLKIDFTEAKIETERILKKAFNYRMVADVPVGVFLSGGYDSTCVASMLQAEQQKKIKTFTIGLKDSKLDESIYAKEIAKIIGTDHTELFFTNEDALSLIEGFSFYFDEPFADSSALPTMLVSSLAKKSVTVALSADAGDEIFAGYNRYKFAQEFIPKINRLPKLARSLLSSIMSTVPLYNLMSDSLGVYRYNKIKEILKDTKGQQTLKILTSQFSDAEVHAVLSSSHDFILSSDLTEKLPTSLEDSISLMMSTDYKTYLADDILQKVDRATMSASLEGREPFLDQNIIEWVAQLPLEYKLKNGVSKFLLKEIVHEYVPKEVMDRPKMGFAIPVEQWLRVDLKEMVLSVLKPSTISRDGIFDVKYVTNLISRFYGGKREDVNKVWHLLIFQLWYNEWMK